MTKIKITDLISYFFTRLRIIPRVFLISYAIMLQLTIMWVMGLPDITTAQSILLSVLCTIATPITKFYIDSGKNLYEKYDEIEHSNKFFKVIDKYGYVFDKLRLVPVIFVLQYTIGFAMLVFWGFGLEEALTKSQATFISVYGGNTAMVFGFLISTDTINRDIEAKYIANNREKQLLKEKNNDQNIS